MCALEPMKEGHGARRTLGKLSSRCSKERVLPLNWTGLDRIRMEWNGSCTYLRIIDRRSELEDGWIERRLACFFTTPWWNGR